jgi:hypothetical protein
MTPVRARTVTILPWKAVRLQRAATVLRTVWCGMPQLLPELEGGLIDAPGGGQEDAQENSDNAQRDQKLEQCSAKATTVADPHLPLSGCESRSCGARSIVCSGAVGSCKRGLLFWIDTQLHVVLARKGIVLVGVFGLHADGKLQDAGPFGDES